jgi:hypothetical protein
MESIEQEQISVVETTLEQSNPFKATAVCPFCQSRKEFYRPNQQMVWCPNKECITKGGHRRLITVVRYVFVNGIVTAKPINVE